MIGTLLLSAALLGGDAPDFRAVDAAVRRGIQRGVYPGAVVVIGNHERILHAERYGRVTWSSRSMRPRSDSTLWDLASLTKVITAGAAMRLVDRGALELDAPVSRYVPQFRGGVRDLVTVRMLLDHTSGLRAYLPLHRAPSRDAALLEVFSDPVQRLPGTSAVYSDLNAILLGLVLEQVSGTTLQQVIHAEVLDPLGMRQTFFQPEPALWRRVAPSVRVAGAPVYGRPSDNNAVALGGVAGHAGLFGTARDLGLFAQAWLRQGVATTGETWVRSQTMAEFLTAGPRAGTRLLGWDTPDPDREGPSFFGREISPLAFGHTGWSGTEMWVDPARDLYVVFLTNRSLEPRTRNSLRAMLEVRDAVSSAAARAVPVRELSVR